MTPAARVFIVLQAAVADALTRGRTWTVAGWTTFFVFAAARVLVPARSDGGAGLSVFGAELLHGLGRSPHAAAAGLPVAILAGFLVCMPIAGFVLGAGPLATHLKDRRLRILALRCSRAELWLGRTLGDAGILLAIALFAALFAVWNGHQRAVALSMHATLIPGLGVGVLAALYGSVFLLAGHLVAVASRGGRRWLLSAVAGLVVLALIARVPGLGLISPLGHLSGLLSGVGSSVAAAAAALAVIGGLIGTAGWLAFRRAAL